MIEGAKFGTFIFFGVFALASLFWTIFICPETKGKTLEELDAIFGHATAGEENRAHEDIIELITRSGYGNYVEQHNEKEVEIHVENIVSEV
jgi:hypothetical protein